MAIIKELDPVQGLVDYILDVKPFHTKIVEVLTEYVHTDAMKVSFAEEFDMEIQFEFPSLLDLERDFQDAGGINLEVHSPDPTNNNAWEEPLGYNGASDKVIVLGDRTDVLVEGNTLLIQLRDANGFLINTASLNITSVTVVPATATTDLHTVVHVPYLRNVEELTTLNTNTLTATLAIPGSTLSTGNTGALGSYGGITPYGAPGSWPVVSYDTTANGPFDPSAPGYDANNNQVILPGDRTTEYTVDKSIEINIISSISGLVDTTIYDITNVSYHLPSSTSEQQHTKITLSNPASSGGLKDANSFVPAGEDIYDLYASITLTPFPIAAVIEGYADGSTNIIMYDDVPRSDDPRSTSPTFDDKTPGEQLAVSNPNETNYTGPETAPNTVDPIIANSFKMLGDVSEIFVPGSIVEVVGTDFTFQVLQTTVFESYTYLRVIETIQPGTYTSLKIRENLVGYSDVFTSSAKSNGTLSTNVVEAITFSWADDGEADVIDGYQFMIIEASGNTVTVNGFAEDVTTIGDQVRIIAAPTNNGQHTVTGVSGSTIQLSASLSNAISGWIEKYNP